MTVVNPAVDVAWAALVEQERYRRSSLARQRRGMWQMAVGKKPAAPIMKEMKSMDSQILELLQDIQARLIRVEEQISQAADDGAFDATGEFPAVSLSAMVESGKVYWKVKGGRYQKHGLSIWPEVLAATPWAHADPLQVHNLAGYTAVWQSNGDGVKKVIELRPPGSPGPKVQSSAERKPKAPKSAENQKPQVSADNDHWLKQCQTAEDTLMFDTAMVRLRPWFQDIGTVRQFREVMFGDWDRRQAKALTAALVAYADKRKELNGSRPTQEAHNLAKTEALNAFNPA